MKFAFYASGWFGTLAIIAFAVLMMLVNDWTIGQLLQNEAPNIHHK